MNLKAQQIAIAEQCQWKRHTQVNWGTYTDEVEGWIHPKLGFSQLLPDYPNDLNGMHNAEKVLTESEHYSYIGMLVDLTDAEWTDAYVEVFKVAHASARQRAEAFCRVKGLWIEDSQ